MSLIKSIFSVLSTLQINIFTLARGKKMGQDMYGNTYFSGKPRAGSKRERRWVLYNGMAEASKVPPEWHGWLHHQIDDYPTLETRSKPKKWQKPHLPNLSGTPYAYAPKGHAKSAGKRDKATGDYQAWTPPQ